jgi:hypothetical protein
MNESGPSLHHAANFQEGFGMLKLNTMRSAFVLSIGLVAIATMSVGETPAHAQSREQSQDARACASFGLRYGTRGYDACMLELYRRADSRQLSTLEEMAITSQIAKEGQIMAERARRQRCDRDPDRRECRRR